MKQVPKCFISIDTEFEIMLLLTYYQKMNLKRQENISIKFTSSMTAFHMLNVF